MPVDLVAWKNLVLDAVDWIAEGALPGQFDPNEQINSLLDDADLARFLKHSGDALNKSQLAAGEHLLDLMDRFCAATPNRLIAADVIADPRWNEIRSAAAAFAKALH